MANKKTKAAAKAVAKGKRRGSNQVPRPLGLNLDAARYARLLADPCNGDLVSGPFGDGSGGMVARFEQEYLVQAGSGSTALAFAFNPALGNWCSTSTVTMGDATNIVWTTNASVALAPGYTFLQANASSYRPLAACMQVYWTGTELNRQGMVSLGRFSNEVLDDTTLSVGLVRAASSYVERTPASMMEMIWRPQEFDTLFRNPASTGLPSPAQGGSANANTTCMVATGSGLPADAPLRIRVVVVYEWMPDPLSGFRTTVPIRGVAPTRLGDILAALDRTGDWMSGTAHSAGKALSSLAHGVASIASLTNGAGRLGARLLGM
jgi:hypothetical protein